MPCSLINRVTDQAFGGLGSFIGRFHRFLIPTITVLALISLSGIWRLRVEDNVRKSYTQDQSMAEKEIKVHSDFVGIRQQVLGLVIIIQANDHGSLMRKQHLKAAIDFLEFYTEEFRVKKVDSRNDDRDDWLTFDHTCEPSCSIIKATRLFLELLYESLHVVDMQSKPLMTHHLDYPITYFYGSVPFHTQLVVYNPELKMAPTANVSQLTNLESFKLLRLGLYSDTQNTSFKADLINWQIKLSEMNKNSEFNPLLKLHILGDPLGDLEMVESGVAISHMTVGGVCVMALFVTCTILWDAYSHHTLDWSCFVLAPACILTPALACGTAFGLFMWTSTPLSSILVMIPVLVIGIGVDDAFLLMHSWRRFEQAQWKLRSLSVDEKMACVLKDIGPSIFVTSFTNVLAFAIGMTSDIPQIRHFAMVTAASILMDFIFELLLFASILCAVSCREENTRIQLQSMSEWSDSSPDKFLDTKKRRHGTVSTRLSFNSEKESPPNTISEIAYISRESNDCGSLSEDVTASYLYKYCMFVKSYVAKMLCVAILAVCLISNLYGLQTIEPQFSPGKLFRTDSVLSRGMKLTADQIDSENYHVTFYVSKPPNVTVSLEFGQLNEFIDRLEHLPFVKPPTFHLYWLREYEQWCKEINDETIFVDWFDVEVESENRSTAFDYELVPMFLETAEHQMWQTFVKWHFDISGKVIMDQWHSIISFSNMSSFTNKAYSYNRWRELVSEYEQFKISVYLFDNSILDLILSIESTIHTSVLATIVCMTFVCSLFVPNLLCVVLSALNIALTVFDVIGCLSLWGSDYDPFMMLTSLMTVGFTVDYTVHVLYHYYASGSNADHQKPVEVRLHETLSTVAYPMFQAGGSTFLCVSFYVFSDIYFPRLFLKSVTLVVGFGMLNGLFILPVTLATIPSRCTISSSIKRNSF